MMQGPEPTRPDTEPMVIDAVNMVRDRFGAVGLRDLVALATQELVRVEHAEARLANIDRGGPAETRSEQLDVADTQAWLAYTEADPE